MVVLNDAVLPGRLPVRSWVRVVALIGVRRTDKAQGQREAGDHGQCLVHGDTPLLVSSETIRRMWRAIAAA
jgi:hypothetical protein